MYWKFTYIYWYSVSKQILFVKADNEEAARKKFNSHFGYEQVDIVNCEQTTEEEILSICVIQ